jgi:hypothetical protein
MKFCELSLRRADIKMEHVDGQKATTYMGALIFTLLQPGTQSANSVTESKRNDSRIL